MKNEKIKLPATPTTGKRLTRKDDEAQRNMVTRVSGDSKSRLDVAAFNSSI